MSLNLIQENLQSLYELELDHNVYDYLITSRRLADMLDSRGSFNHAREKLLIHEDDEGLNLSLYLDEEIAGLFREGHYYEQLDESRLEEFCLALEGISHFLYLVWNATHDRSVTLMEMELQAEVDKFILLSRYFRQRRQQPAPGQLHRLLFTSAGVHGDLGHAEGKRYYEASRYAQAYCRRLEADYFGDGGELLLLNELRRFYRLNQRGKLERINRFC